MPYKDADRQREANRQNQRRYRQRQRQARNQGGFQFDSPLAFHRALLGLENVRLTHREITRAQRRFAKTVHPDKNTGPEATRLMQMGNAAAVSLKAIAPK